MNDYEYNNDQQQQERERERVIKSGTSLGLSFI